MATYTRYTTATYDFEDAADILKELSHKEGFIGGNYHWINNRVKVVVYLNMPCPKMDGFSEIKKLPDVMLVWHEATLKLPKGLTWFQYAQTIKNEPLRVALNAYIDTWLNLPDTIVVKYLGVN
jgi:hypothetical protein